MSDDPDLREYVSRNLALGRLSGQQRIRIRYRKFATPFYDYGRISPSELQNLVAGTGWVMNDVLDRGEGNYVAVLEKRSRNVTELKLLPTGCDHHPCSEVHTGPRQSTTLSVKAGNTRQLKYFLCEITPWN